MELPLVIQLDGEPGAKLRVRFDPRSKRAYQVDKVIHYEGRLAHAGQLAMDEAALLDEPLKVDIDAFFGIPQSKSKKWQRGALDGSTRPTKKPDVDNIAKIVMDGLNGIVWIDDVLIVELSVRKHYSDRPRMVVTVHRLD
jgi:Holliday junction resolvase RusA-like endonuclease